LIHVLPAGIKSLPDGTYYAPRSSMYQSIKYMDEHFIRLKGELKWLPHRTNIVIPDVTPSVHIIGKGPSLDKISFLDLNGEDSIFCINESIHKIADLNLLNDLYVVQQDLKLGRRCVNSKAKMFANVFCCGLLQDDATYYDPTDLGLPAGILSVEVAMCIASLGGAKEVYLWAFDGAKTGTVLGYAKCIGTDPKWGGNPIRFATHHDIIVARAAKLGLEIMFM